MRESLRSNKAHRLSGVPGLLRRVPQFLARSSEVIILVMCLEWVHVRRPFYVPFSTNLSHNSIRNSRSSRILVDQCRELARVGRLRSSNKNVLQGLHPFFFGVSHNTAGGRSIRLQASAISNRHDIELIAYSCVRDKGTNANHWLAGSAELTTYRHDGWHTLCTRQRD